MRQLREREVRRGLGAAGRLARLCEVARRVTARRAGLLARGFAVVVAAGADGAPCVVTVAAGRRAARTTTRGLVFAGAGSGRGELAPLGAASGPAGSWAPAGTAAASDAAATTATQRRCALAPMSANRTWPTRPYSRLRGPATAHPPIWVGERAVARRPAHPEPADGARPRPQSTFLAWTGLRSFFRHPRSPPEPWSAIWHVELLLPAADSARRRWTA